MRILIVEDEAIVAWDMADGLGSQGCEVVGPAYDLTEAVQLSRERGLSIPSRQAGWVREILPLTGEGFRRASG